jgi:hypothetical protein
MYLPKWDCRVVLTKLRFENTGLAAPFLTKLRFENTGLAAPFLTKLRFENTGLAAPFLTKLRFENTGLAAPFLTKLRFENKMPLKNQRSKLLDFLEAFCLFVTPTGFKPVTLRAEI